MKGVADAYSNTHTSKTPKAKLSQSSVPPVNLTSQLGASQARASISLQHKPKPPSIPPKTSNTDIKEGRSITSKKVVNDGSVRVSTKSVANSSSSDEVEHGNDAYYDYHVDYDIDESNEVIDDEVAGQSRTKSMRFKILSNKPFKSPKVDTDKKTIPMLSVEKVIAAASRTTITSRSEGSVSKKNAVEPKIGEDLMEGSSEKVKKSKSKRKRKNKKNIGGAEGDSGDDANDTSSAVKNKNKGMQLLKNADIEDDLYNGSNDITFSSDNRQGLFSVCIANSGDARAALQTGQTPMRIARYRYYRYNQSLSISIIR